MKRSRSAHQGRPGSNFIILVNRTVAISATPIGRPGWPRIGRLDRVHGEGRSAWHWPNRPPRGAQKGITINRTEADTRQLINERARLASDLDKATARLKRLDDGAHEVSRRLVTAMETVRAVLAR
jgi:hypothetical protein